MIDNRTALRAAAPGLTIAGIVVLAAILAALLLPTGAQANGPKCYEDEPCWSWPTMGNLQRGVFVKDRKRRVIVNACQYAVLVELSLIDRKRTVRLRGDRFAINHGCDDILFG